jgi:hypothetical protein
MNIRIYEYRVMLKLNVLDELNTKYLRLKETANERDHGVMKGSTGVHLTCIVYQVARL